MADVGCDAARLSFIFILKGNVKRFFLGFLQGYQKKTCPGTFAFSHRLFIGF